MFSSGNCCLSFCVVTLLHLDLVESGFCTSQVIGWEGYFQTEFDLQYVEQNI